MRYGEHYTRLVERAKARQLSGYVERHHVVPRCLGGAHESGNVVNLTPEEHFVAHLLLVRMYPGVRGLVVAALMMARRCTGNKAYGWIRRKCTQEPFSQEHRQNISRALLGKSRGPQSPEHRARIAGANRGKRPSALCLERAAAAHRGTHPIMSAEQREKISKAKAGVKRGPFSEAWRRNIAAAATGRRHSEQTKAKMSRVARSRGGDGRYVPRGTSELGRVDP